MGVGTAKDIAQYFHVDAWWDRASVDGRRPPGNTHVLFDELVEAGRLELARVEGWKRPAYVVADAGFPSQSMRVRSCRRSIR
jgi:hypothetical protein